MKSNKEELFITKIKTELEQIPEREASKVTEGKARFLAQAKMIKRSPVPVAVPERRSMWNLKQIKEANMGTIVTILVVIGLFLGGVGGTVAAAQNDLPGQALYQVKLLSEGLKQDLTIDPQKKVELDLQFAMRRLDEIKELIDAGIEPPYMSYARFENLLSHAVGQAALLEKEDGEKALLRIREMLHIRAQQIDQGTEDAVQQQTRTLLQQRIQWLDEGLIDPERFLNEARIGWETAPNQGEISGPQNSGVTDENPPDNQGQPEEMPGTGPGNATQDPGEGNESGQNNGGTNGGSGGGSNGH